MRKPILESHVLFRCFMTLSRLTAPRTLRIVLLTLLLAWLVPVLVPTLAPMARPQAQAPWLEICRSPDTRGLEGKATTSSRIGTQEGVDGEMPHGIACPSCALACSACALALGLPPGRLESLKPPALGRGPVTSRRGPGWLAKHLPGAALPRAPPAA